MKSGWAGTLISLTLVLAAAPSLARAESPPPPPCHCNDDCIEQWPYSGICVEQWGGRYCDYSGPGIACDGGPAEAEAGLRPPPDGGPPLPPDGEPYRSDGAFPEWDPPYWDGRFQGAEGDWGGDPCECNLDCEGSYDGPYCMQRAGWRACGPTGPGRACPGTTGNPGDPTPREGCSCAVAEPAGSGAGASVLLLLLAAVALRSRRGRRPR